MNDKLYDNPLLETAIKAEKKEREERLKLKNTVPTDYFLKEISIDESGYRLFLYQSLRNNDFYIEFYMKENDLEYPLVECLFHKTRFVHLNCCFDDHREIADYLWEKFFDSFKYDKLMKPFRIKYLFLTKK